MAAPELVGRVRWRLTRRVAGEDSETLSRLGPGSGIWVPREQGGGAFVSPTCQSSLGFLFQRPTLFNT